MWVLFGTSSTTTTNPYLFRTTQIGTSRDTSEFACDSIYYWWTEYGRKAYAEATSILLLCDGGGSNGSRFYIFKQDLQQLANDLGIEFRIAHYPPYTSKYNPIEHRLFPHLSRVCRGVIFDSVERVQELMAQATTQTGLGSFRERTYRQDTISPKRVCYEGLGYCHQLENHKT